MAEDSLLHGPEEAPVPVMPDFSTPYRGFHHTVDSALEVLFRLGVSPSRITLRMEGRGYPSHQVVSQRPPAGSPLPPGQSIVLSVAGLGFFHSLPAGMWDKGGEAEAGTQEIVEVLDDPIQKAAHWVRDGACLFDVHPDNPDACARWIRLFGLSPEEWPREVWYDLSLLLPSVHRLAGKDIGIRLALQIVLKMPLHEIRRKRAHSYMDDDDLSLLGGASSRLGVDSILGDRIETVSRLILVIGPVPLTTHDRYQREDDARVLDSVIRLCLPMHHSYRIFWRVQNPGDGPRLGLAEQNSVLGVNTYLGAPTPERESMERTLRIERRGRPIGVRP